MSDTRDSHQGTSQAIDNLENAMEMRREGARGAADHHHHHNGIEDDSVTRRSRAETGDARTSIRETPNPSMAMMSTEKQSPPRQVTEEDIQKLRDDLQQSLQEEERLTIAQMQLISQLEKINGSIISLEKEERMGKLAIQQAQIIRLLKKAQDPGNMEIDDETITITPER